MTCVNCAIKYGDRGSRTCPGKCIFRKCRSWGKSRVVVASADGGDEEEVEDHNDADCYVCKNGGDLICCDSCPKVFHSNCSR